MPSAAGPAFTADVPDNPDARAFAQRLVGVEITHWAPRGTSDFLYDSLDFKRDGTFSAEAVLKVGGEQAPCAETGTWKLDEVESAEVATVEIALTKTNCATRSTGESQRLHTTLQKNGSYEIAFR